MLFSHYCQPSPAGVSYKGGGLGSLLTGQGWAVPENNVLKLVQYKKYGWSDVVTLFARRLDPFPFWLALFSPSPLNANAVFLSGIPSFFRNASAPGNLNNSLLLSPQEKTLMQICPKASTQVQKTLKDKRKLSKGNKVYWSIPGWSNKPLRLF